MVGSMLSNSTLLMSLWMEALKTAAHISNHAPSKSVPKTPYELWTGRKPSISYLHIWGCAAETKLYNPSLGKLDTKIESCYFIGYPDKPKGYRFYCPKGTIKFVETRNAMFLEEMDALRVGKSILRKFELMMRHRRLWIIMCLF
jgi:hypothetical protein